MKRLIFIFLSLILCLINPISYVTIHATSNDATTEDIWPDGPDIYAESAIVMEASTGLILYEKNMHETRYPASITKIMTALLAIENSSLGEVVTFSKDAVFNVDLDSSRIGIDVGEQLTMQQCLYGVLLESANEVTYAVAEHVGGSISGFAQMMNEKAESLGCLNTNFVNPHGLHNDDHVTTAYDMALITRAAIKNETFLKIFGTRTYQYPPTNIQPDTRYLRHHHRFILKQDFFYDDCIGGKTGYTNKARYSLVTVAKRGDLELISVIIKDDSFNYQYTDTQKLLDFGFNNFSIYPIADLETNQILHESPLFTMFNSLLSKSETPIITDEKGYLVLPNTASFEDAIKDVSFFSTSEIIEGSNVIGTISYTYHDKFVGGADIIYNNIKKPTLTNIEPIKENSTISPDESIPEESVDSLRPLIIGAIVGVLLLIIGFYFVFVERPRLKRRNAYKKKRANRRLYQNDDFLDL